MTLNARGLRSRCDFHTHNNPDPKKVVVLGSAIGALLSHWYFWILVHYGVPVGIIVLGCLTGPSPNAPFAWDVALTNWVCQAIVVASYWKLFWPVWFLTYAVFARLSMALYRLAKRTLAKETQASASTSPAVAAKSLLVGNFPVVEDATEHEDKSDEAEEDKAEEDEVFFDAVQE